MQGKPQGVGSRLLTYGKVWLLQVALVLLVAGAFYQSAMDWERLLLILGVDVAASLLLILPMIGPGLAQAEHAERVLKRLGFANPSGINLARFQERAWKQTVFNLKLALEATRQRGRP